MTGESSAGKWAVRGLLLAAVAAAGYFAVVAYLRQTATVVTAIRAKAVKTVLGTVVVQAEFVQELKSEVGGRVAESALVVGGRVARGDVLVRLDPGDVDLELERLGNELAAARRRAEAGSTLRPDVLNLRDTIANLELLVRAGGYPPADLEKQRRNLQQLEQRLELDEAATRLALANLETAQRATERKKAKMIITAPLDGVVMSVLARVGDLIDTNAPIATIMTASRVVEGSVSEESFAAIAPGQKASVRFLTYGANQYNATITKVLPAADPLTQRYRIHLAVTMPEDKALAPGLTGEMSITVAERDGAVLIPRRALVGDFVYVVAGDRVAIRKVEKGYESLNQLEVLSGVAEGESVIVEQQDLFRAGDRVRTVVVPK